MSAHERCPDPQEEKGREEQGGYAHEAVIAPRTRFAFLFGYAVAPFTWHASHPDIVGYRLYLKLVRIQSGLDDS